MRTSPQLRNVSIIRCDANGVANDGGAYFKASATIIPGYFAYEVICYYDKTNIQVADTDIDTSNSDEHRLETGALGGDLDANESYLVSVMVKEDGGYATSTAVLLPAESVFMHKDGAKNSIGIGEKVTEENTVSIAERMNVKVKGPLVLQAADNYAVHASGSGFLLESSDRATLINAGYFGVGDDSQIHAGISYDTENERGYVFVNCMPEHDNEAANKAYVDGMINALRKELGL